MRTNSKIRKTKKKLRRPLVVREVYRPLAKVISAIIELGHHLHTITVVGDMAIVSELPKKSPYHTIQVYSDGVVEFYDRLGTPVSQSKAQRVSQLKKNILNWKPTIDVVYEKPHIKIEQQ